MTQHRSYFAIIPASVRYDKNLPANAKLLYGEITALCNEKGYCWAGDRYFADLYGVSKTTIQSWIKALYKNGYITKEVIYKEGTKEILHRYIKIIEYPMQENLTTPIQENLRDNNTSFNNTFNNTNKEVESSSHKYSNEHLRLAKKLQSNLTEDFPKEMDKVNVDKWADVFRLMEERDSLSIEAIEYVIDWLPTNKFWFGNIRSAKKLREKFERLKFDIKAEKEKSKKNNSGYQKNVRREQLPKWVNDPPKEKKLDAETKAMIDKRFEEYLKWKNDDK
ncbi:helix-turn-helix domain-containing protein [Enterococcus hirae]|uniref:helix-turn-helix domain-containing protein n=1 Tax=Enterococcus hirae TaxID=1354 RepID=UPI0009BCCE11|nr:helix-turn-helix domain-containing protein [Enterococcus hirae]EMF0307651.1 helix-turn-helix domain-containing protein [Enterococcus hirae]OQO33486.1 hypothetical protein BH731_11295 [Enterococcus hirae]OQO39270.1 hypothetical protein BH738_01385 [Enterococcus hirae]